MKQTKIVLSDMYIAGAHSAEVLLSGIQSFDFPATPVSPQRASILRGGFDAVSAVPSNQFDTLTLQTPIQRIAAVGSIPDQTLRFCQDKSRCESCLHKGDFIWRSTFNANGERKTIAVCQRHDLRTFATFGLSPTARPSFLRRQRSRR